MERFAFKGVASNLVTYLTQVVKMSNSSAAKMVNNWCGFTSMLPLLVAPVADSYWDTYSTIQLSSFLYASVSPCILTFLSFFPSASVLLTIIRFSSIHFLLCIPCEFVVRYLPILYSSSRLTPLAFLSPKAEKNKKII